MGITVRHDVAGILPRKDKSSFSAGMDMVKQQQASDNAMRLAQMQPLKYGSVGVGIGEQKRKPKPDIVSGQAFGVDTVLPQQQSMPSWQEQNSDIIKNIGAGAYSNPVSRQLRDLVTRQQMLMSSQTLNDAQKQIAFDRFERNKRALIEAYPLDPSVEVAVRDQQQNDGPSFEQWSRTNFKDFNTEFRNTQTRLIEQGIEKPTSEQIIQVMRQPFDAMRSMSQPKPSQPPAAAADDDNPYGRMLDELQSERGIAERRYGGPVYPGQTVTVGEEGPELMQVGYDGVAQVAPNPRTMARMQEDRFPDTFGAEAILAQMANTNPSAPAAPAATQSLANVQQQPQQTNAPAAKIQYNQNIGYEQYNDDFRNELANRARGQQVLDKIDAHTAAYEKWKFDEAARLYNQRPVAADTPSIGKPKVWTNNRGKTITGELRGVRHFNDVDPAVSDVAVIRTKEGKTYAIPLQDLSEKDRAIVMQTPDYASETRMEGENQGTYQEMFNPDTPEGQRMREPRPRQAPTPEQLESGRKGKYGVGGVSGGMLSQRGGARQEAPPAYQQPVLQDGQIATSPGLASQPGIRVTGPKGERLPPADANMDPRDTSPFTQLLAELGPTEGKKWTEALKKKGRWLFRDADSEELLKKAGKLKKRGVDGYGKPYALPSDEPQFQPPARPAWWDGWKDPNAQERRLTPEELASRGYMVNPAGQVVPIPRDSQGRPVMQTPSAPQQQAPPPAPQTASSANKWNPDLPIVQDALGVLKRTHTQQEKESALETLKNFDAPERVLWNLPDNPSPSPTAQQDKYVARDKEGRPYAINDPIWGPIGSFLADPLGPYNPLGGKKPSASPNTTQSQQPAQQPAQQGVPTIDAMTSQIAQQQTQKRKPSALPEKQPGVQDQKFWNGFWSNNRPAYEMPKNLTAPISTLTSADGKFKMKGFVGRISEPMEDINGQRVITFQRDDGAVVTFYSGQLSKEDQERMEKNLTPDKRSERASKERASEVMSKVRSPWKYVPKAKKSPAKSVETITPVTGPVAWDGGNIPSKEKGQ